jgi:hypothetical protein
MRYSSVTRAIIFLWKWVSETPVYFTALPQCLPARPLHALATVPGAIRATTFANMCVCLLAEGNQIEDYDVPFLSHSFSVGGVGMRVRKTLLLVSLFFKLQFVASTSDKQNGYPLRMRHENRLNYSACVVTGTKQSIASGISTDSHHCLTYYLRIVWSGHQRVANLPVLPVSASDITLLIVHFFTHNTGCFKKNFTTLKTYIYLFVAFLQSTQDIKRVISKRDGCVYPKQVPSVEGSLEFIWWDPLATFCWVLNLFRGHTLYSVLNCHNVAKHTEFYLWLPLVMQMCFKKELCNFIPDVTVWRVLRKRLNLKAYKLSIVQHFEWWILCTPKCKRYRNTRHTVTFGIPL